MSAKWSKSQQYEKRYVNDELYKQWNIPYSKDYWLKFMHIDKVPESALDVGCGNLGIWRFSDRVIGLDPIDFSDLGDNFIQGNAEDLPFEDNRFNDVYGINMLDHCENPQKAMNEICRVSKDRVVIYLNTFHWLTRPLFRLAYRPHPHTFTYDETIALVPPNMKVVFVHTSGIIDIYRPYMKFSYAKLKLLIANTLGARLVVFHLRKEK